MTVWTEMAAEIKRYLTEQALLQWVNTLRLTVYCTVGKQLASMDLKAMMWSMKSLGRAAKALH